MQASQSSSVPSTKAFSLLKEDYFCPISFQIMQTPMILPCCGQTFQKIVIQRCLTLASICPICRTKVNFSQAIINRALKKAIETFKDMMAKKQERRRREVQEQLQKIAGRRYSELIREGLQNGRQMTPEELAMFEILPTSQKLVRLAIQQILEGLRLEEQAKYVSNVSATQALNFAKKEFGSIITDT